MNGDIAIKRETKPAKGRPENNKTPINDQIKAREVRLIDAEGTQVGVVPLSEALAAAQAAQLDLVQITDGDPLVCKIMDFGKKIFEDKKARNLAKKKQVQSQVKEMKFRPGTDEGDYQVKLRNLIRFLEHGDKAKVTLRFRGREMAHQELGMKLLQRIEEDLKAYGVVEMHPKMEGRQLTMMLAPQKKK